MRNLRLKLTHVVALVLAAPGCSSTGSESSCPPAQQITVSAATACAIATNGQPFVPSSHYIAGTDCTTACNNAGVTGGDSYLCTFPADYFGDGSLTCSSSSVSMGCQADCTGRRTDGMATPLVRARRNAGDYFSDAAYLEAVSAQAFARLARELEAHAAPSMLVAHCRRAHAEEIRHAETTAALARRFGGRPEMPAEVTFEERTLFDIALENAVEGCVRETLGAALAMMRAERANDSEVRAALRTIAHEECGHAELSWALDSWVIEKLADDEREQIRRARKQAAQELLTSAVMLDANAHAVTGMPRAAEQRALAELVDAHVFRDAA